MKRKYNKFTKKDDKLVKDLNRTEMETAKAKYVSKSISTLIKYGSQDNIYKKLNEIYILANEHDDDLVAKAVEQALIKEMDYIIAVLEKVDPENIVNFLKWKNMI